ncbi:MAG TPA: cell division ATP-binding protein FtsE [Verrucomicrobiae bacterium]|nr:cell division ATP-binding protein FtsE [Verrucomicrobiae bacterium]
MSDQPDAPAPKAASKVQSRLVRHSPLKRVAKPAAEPDNPPAQAEEDSAAPVSRPVLVEFRDITKEYGNHVALSHVSLKLFKGEFLSVVGPSGAGKSTLIKCLTLQERPDAGSILVAGRDITTLRARDLPYYRRKVGIVFQDFKLLTGKTVYENVAFALEVSGVGTREIKERVHVMLETVGMLAKRDNFPHELSGGEQQRVAIARALVHDPKILIADEPTGNLDPVNTWEIIELLYKINRSGTMVILATHDREIVDALKKRVITMRAGNIVADQEKGVYLV